MIDRLSGISASNHLDERERALSTGSRITILTYQTGFPDIKILQGAPLFPERTQQCLCGALTGQS